MNEHSSRSHAVFVVTVECTCVSYVYVYYTSMLPLSSVPPIMHLVYKSGSPIWLGN